MLLAHVSSLPGDVTLLGRMLRKENTPGGSCRDIPSPVHVPPAPCDHDPRLDRPKDVQAVVYLGLTKGASDPERCHHLCQASSGQAGRMRQLRKTCTFPNQQRNARLDVLGHPKCIKVFIPQRIH